jgi:hypothetical protein
MNNQRQTERENTSMSSSPTRTRRLLAASLPLIALLAGSASTAEATGSNIRSTLFGTACKYHNVEGIGQGDYYDQGMYNVLGPSIMICPIERKNVYNTNGLADLEIRFKAFSSEFSQPVLCEAFSFRQDGSILKMVTLTANSPVDGSWFKVDFKNSLNMSDPWGYYNVACFVPNSMMLQGVYINEPPVK